MSVIKLVQPTEASPCNEVLREALDTKMTAVVVVGFDGERNDYFNASMTDAPTAIYLLQRAIHRLNQSVDLGLKGD